MRTTVRLPEELLRRAKKRAAEQGLTLTAMLEEGLKLVLAEPRPKSARRAPIRLPVSKASGGMLPGVDLNQSSDLLDRMEGR